MNAGAPIVCFAIGGVNEINHLPGFRPDWDDLSSYGDLTRYALTDDDARRPARASHP